jgi:AraC-like DNA-binding protein
MESGSFPHSLGVLSRLAADRAAKAGTDIDVLKRQADLPADLENSEARVSARSQSIFLNLVSDAIRDDLLGFHIALDIELRRLGPLYYVMASSDTLGEALMREERYMWTVTEGLRTIVRKTGDLTIETQFVGIERHLDRHQIEFWLTCTVRKSRILTGRHLIPKFVEWVHQRTRPVDEMDRFFGMQPTFGAASDRLGFPREAAELPLTSRDPHLRRFLLDVLEDSGSARTGTPSDLRTRLENAITPRLPHGTANQEAIARELGLSKRSLIRKLGDEGLSFRRILDELRANFAIQYLADGIPQAQIAWLLGFREPKAFARAFRRWTGAAPSAFRTKAGSSRDLRFRRRTRTRD